MNTSMLLLVEWDDKEGGLINDYSVCGPDFKTGEGELTGEAAAFNEVAPKFSVYDLVLVAEVERVTVTTTKIIMREEAE